MVADLQDRLSLAIGAREEGEVVRRTCGVLYCTSLGGRGRRAPRGGLLSGLETGDWRATPLWATFRDAADGRGRTLSFGPLNSVLV